MSLDVPLSDTTRSLALQSVSAFAQHKLRGRKPDFRILLQLEGPYCPILNYIFVQFRQHWSGGRNSNSRN